MWANVGFRPLYCHMNHTHPNSIFSGVWHVSTPNLGTPFAQTTTFSDPRPAARVIEPSVNKDHAAHNSGTVSPIVNNGSLFMFPSWLPHGVQQSYQDTKGIPRITISFNAMMTGAEGSIKTWTGKAFKIGALVVLIVTLISVITNGMDAMNSASGLGQVSAIVCLLILVYATFPIAQVIRSAGDSLSSSGSSTVDFIFRDFVTENIKALGHITALVALFGALCSTVGWILNSSGMSMDVDLYSGAAYAYALPLDATATLLEMIRLDYVGGIISDFFSWDLTGSDATGYTIDGLVAVGWEYAQVILILAKLYLALAIYNWVYGLVSTLAKWISSPSLPFKTS
jgi:hypothetical protein